VSASYFSLSICGNSQVGTVVEVHPRVGLIRVRVRVRVSFRVRVRVRPAGELLRQRRCASQV